MNGGPCEYLVDGGTSLRRVASGPCSAIRASSIRSCSFTMATDLVHASWKSSDPLPGAALGLLSEFLPFVSPVLLRGQVDLHDGHHQGDRLGIRVVALVKERVQEARGMKELGALLAHAGAIHDEDDGTRLPDEVVRDSPVLVIGDAESGKSTRTNPPSRNLASHPTSSVLMRGAR